MSLSIPSLDDLRAQALTAIQNRLLGGKPILRRSPLRVIAEILARMLFPLYRLLDWLWRQLFVATMEAAYLDRAADEYGIVRLGATSAAGAVVATGINGTPIPPGTPLGANGIQLRTASAIALGSGATTIPVVAVTLGVAGNLPPGTAVTWAVAISGVDAGAVVASGGLTGGTDAETDAALRAHVLTRKRLPPQGGAATDYVAWAKTVPGVTRAWAYSLNRGLGTVDVVFAMDGRANNIPLTADVAAVQVAIDANRPTTADARAVAPIADTLAITVSGLLPSDAATRANVTASIAALIDTVTPAQPSSPASMVGDGVPSPGSPCGVLYLAQIVQAVWNAGGVTKFDLAAPSADVTFAPGHLPATPVSVTFV